MARIVDLMQPDAKGNVCKNLAEAEWKLVSMAERHENKGNTVEKNLLQDEYYPRIRVMNQNNQVIHVYTIEL